ncbi:hypothetical protein LA345_12870 [Burkholderia vietnamiensis]|uniref:Glycine zipper domain-containing protein n=1 Tax=Burkholderia vietnamiensis (strain G4 / LMG 22486) TaxID=269482 RepID=A4JFJ1_BURVG|nr:hypothetical protein Bcep1808_2042 [Burkholderia vietnamiensis G4]MCB4344804.1 hypothetical protein [Burkholderia vietnamiensis]
MSQSTQPTSSRLARAGLIAATALSLLGLSACQTMSSVSDSVSGAFTNTSTKVGSVFSTNKTTEAEAGGGILGLLGGCGVGAVAGGLSHGVSGAIKGCLIGGAVGGVAGALAARHEQLKEAKALEAQAQGTAMKVSVSSAPVAAASSGSAASAANATNDERLKTLRVAVPDSSVAARDPGVASAAEKIGKIAALSPTGATVEVSGPAASRDWLIGQIKQGMPDAASANKITFVSNPGSHTQIVVTPANDNTAVAQA